MIRRVLCLSMLLAAIAALTACDEKLSSIAGPTPNLEPTFTSIQTEIFETTDSAGRVACTGCHNAVGRVPAGLLNLTRDVAYDNLARRDSRHSRRSGEQLHRAQGGRAARHCRSAHAVQRPAVPL
jgi:hypothetical protein